ncbi:hypothetical protein T492DRAFT_1091702 [Pavlovales sp. CCMP2436]|nr:hypothetical protein T492DRAFT_1091702 [Pavlovales sp. CCMP2436]
MALECVREDIRSYLATLVEKARLFGLAVYIDPHQDVWSRFSGGDGAPGWTFEKVGLDVRAFQETGAALVHQTYAGDKSAFPRMCWPTNLHKLACATMFTLFWAGNAFAPNFEIDGQSAQDYLQGHYTRAMVKVAEAVFHLPNVLGFGTMNEPLPGYIGIRALDKLSGPLKNDLMPTPFEGMALGSGFEVKVGRYAIDSLKCLALGMPLSTELTNSGKRSAWLPGRECVWRQHGVWDVNSLTGLPRLLEPNYFAKKDFGLDFYVPFTKAFARDIRTAGHADWLIFVEMPPADLGLCPFPIFDTEHLGGGVVHAPHWYDQLTLFLGKFVKWASFDVQKGSPHFGAGSVSRLRSRQLRELLHQAGTHVGGAPTMIGEVGIPFDMHEREAYGGLVNNCVVCYAADHTPEWGDGWNREDLSLYSETAAREVPLESDPHGVHLGGRALAAFVRPYVQAVAGTLVGTPVYDAATRTYELVFRHDPTITEPTLVYVPTAVQYRDGYEVYISDGEYDLEMQPAKAGGFVTVRYKHDPRKQIHTLTVAPKGGLGKGRAPTGIFAGMAGALFSGAAKPVPYSAPRSSPPPPFRGSPWNPRKAIRNPTSQTAPEGDSRCTLVHARIRTPRGTRSEHEEWGPSEALVLPEVGGRGAVTGSGGAVSGMGSGGAVSGMGSGGAVSGMGSGGAVTGNACDCHSGGAVTGNAWGIVPASGGAEPGAVSGAELLLTDGPPSGQLRRLESSSEMQEDSSHPGQPGEPSNPAEAHAGSRAYESGQSHAPADDPHNSGETYATRALNLLLQRNSTVPVLDSAVLMAANQTDPPAAVPEQAAGLLRVQAATGPYAGPYRRRPSSRVPPTPPVSPLAARGALARPKNSWDDHPPTVPRTPPPRSPVRGRTYF